MALAAEMSSGTPTISTGGCLVLFMFVSNIRTAVIVAINIPLALAFAFAMLFLRGNPWLSALRCRLPL
jgi:hypothetical protein